MKRTASGACAAELQGPSSRAGCVTSTAEEDTANPRSGLPREPQPRRRQGRDPRATVTARHPAAVQQGT
eukprot:268240-Pyramimonas_sp.AAC.1